MLCYVTLMIADAFELRFDATRAGSAVRVTDAARTHTSWGLAGGSIFGDRVCTRGAVSYWECTGLGDDSYVGVVEEERRGRMRYGVTFFQRALSMPVPACNHMPAVMYGASGIITTGAFYGPKPQLPVRASVLRVQPCTERSDRVGVCVDLLKGTIMFVLNGCVQGAPVSLDPNAVYRPVFSARLCDAFQMIPDAVPPWMALYDLQKLLPVTTTHAVEP